jgi:hypothetical protein
MKSRLTAILAATPLAALAAFFMAGCASSDSKLVLAPVGPPQPPMVSLNSDGTLLVYTAYQTGVPSPYLPENLRQHSDYDLRGDDGKLLRHISNQAGDQSEAPVPVPLPAGSYKIVARTNGFGLVTVPVVIVAGRLTELHLEGGASWSAKHAFNDSNSVRLPDGEVIGWKADGQSSPAVGPAKP